MTRHPELRIPFDHFVKADPSDKFGKSARAKVFWQCIVIDTNYRTTYLHLLKEYTFVPDPELVQQLIDSIYLFGWKNFFVALRSAVMKISKPVRRGSVNERRFEKSLEALHKVPPTVELPSAATIMTT